VNISFTNINCGEQYSRKELADIWGYKDFHAIARGIITPKGSNYLILFITKEKQSIQFQYADILENGILRIEGETNHSADSKIINASQNGRHIQLFYREIHHTTFIYYGEINLIKHVENKELPSKFIFSVPYDKPDHNLETELLTHGIVNESIINEAEGRKKIQKHVRYERSKKNRLKAIEIHGCICKACGFDFNAKYGAELSKDYIEIHHIESITSGQRIINPEIDLVPLCSNCHSMVHRKRGEILSIEVLKELISRIN